MGFGARRFSVYVHSYLGYGLMAARAAALEQQGGPACAFSGGPSSYPYAGKDHPVAVKPEGPEFTACMGVMDSVLDDSKPCGGPRSECGFNGAWAGAGPKESQPLFVSSYFFDRAIDSGVLEDKTMIQAEITPRAYKDAAERVCSEAGVRSAAAVRARYGTVEEPHAPFFCMDLTFQYALLTKGFRLPETRPVTLVRRVVYKGQPVEASWPVGAALETMSSAGTSARR